MTPRKVGVRGPGAIGGPLAARLRQARHDVRLLAGDQPAIATALVTRHRTMYTPPLAFLRSVSRPSTAHLDPGRAISIVPAHPFASA